MLRQPRVLRYPNPAESGGEPPPATKAVLNSDADPEDAQEIVRLRRDNGEKDKRLKERETRISELEDENHRLKTPKPATAPAKSKESILDEWLY